MIMTDEIEDESIETRPCRMCEESGTGPDYRACQFCKGAGFITVTARQLDDWADEPGKYNPLNPWGYDDDF